MIVVTICHFHGRWKRCLTLFAGILLAVFLAGCSEESETGSSPPPTDNPPKITLFTANPDSVSILNPAVFSFRATDDNGIDSAVLSYGDGARSLVTRRAQQNVSATLSRTYLRIGTFTATLFVYDTRQQVDFRTTQIVISN